MDAGSVKSDQCEIRPPFQIMCRPSFRANSVLPGRALRRGAMTQITQTRGRVNHLGMETQYAEAKGELLFELKEKTTTVTIKDFTPAGVRSEYNLQGQVKGK